MVWCWAGVSIRIIYPGLLNNLEEVIWDVLYINKYLMYPRMVIYAMIKVVRPVLGWRENKYIATPHTQPYLPSGALGKICNVFEVGKDEFEV